MGRYVPSCISSLRKKHQSEEIKLKIIVEDKNEVCFLNGR